MSIVRTIVEVEKFVYDKEGNQVDINNKTITSKRISKQILEPKTTMERYYLLHWGLQVTIYGDQTNPIPVSYTVGICQHIKTGDIETFLPTQMRVIGKEINK